MEIKSKSQFNLEDLVIRKRQEISKETWDSFVDLSPQAWLFHTYDFQDAFATWPGKNDLSFALIDENRSGEIIALLPLHRQVRPYAKILPNCSLDSTGGYALHPDLTTKQNIKVTSQLIDVLKVMGNEFNAEEINISISPLSPSMRGEACPRINPLVLLGMQNTASHTYIINLQRTKEEIWNGMESYCRTHIRKAEKTGYSIRTGSSHKDLEAYYELHCKTYFRTKVKPHPFQYFESIWKNFVFNGKARVFFAEMDGKIISADNEAVFKNAMGGWTAAGESGLTSGVNNLLHWTAIQWAIDQGFDYYESGEGFPGEQSGKRKGLTDFKKSFGGELYPFFRGRIIQRSFLHNFRQLFKSLK